MASRKEKPAKRETKTDLVAQYRPLGLKAVLAAHLMLKSKPAAQVSHR